MKEVRSPGAREMDLRLRDLTLQRCIIAFVLVQVSFVDLFARLASSRVSATFLGAILPILPAGSVISP